MQGFLPPVEFESTLVNQAWQVRLIRICSCHDAVPFRPVPVRPFRPVRPVRLCLVVLVRPVRILFLVRKAPVRTGPLRTVPRQVQSIQRTLIKHFRFHSPQSENGKQQAGAKTNGRELGRGQNKRAGAKTNGRGLKQTGGG